MPKKLLMNNYSENGLMPNIYFNFCDYDKYVFVNDGVKLGQRIDIVSSCEDYRFIGTPTANEARPASKVLTESEVVNGLKTNTLRLVNKSMKLSMEDYNDITVVICYKNNETNAFTLFDTNLGGYRHSTKTLFLFGDRQKWTEPTVSIFPLDELSVGSIISTENKAEYYNNGTLVTSTTNQRKIGAVNTISFNNLKLGTTPAYTLYSLSLFGRVLTDEEITSYSQNEFNKFFNL